MEYDKTNKGTMSRNEDRKNDSHPEFKGSINVEGKEYWLSGWVREAKQGNNKGKKFFSLAIKPK